MNIIDTRDLIDERNELKERILDDFNEKFNTEFTDFEELPLGDDLGEIDYLEQVEDLDEFKGYWEYELKQIEEIDNIENECEEFDFGCTLIDEDDFQEYCEDLVSDIGDLPKDLPSYISNNIDWSGVADDLRVDYSVTTSKYLKQFCGKSAKEIKTELKNKSVKFKTLE